MNIIKIILFVIVFLVSSFSDTNFSSKEKEYLKNKKVINICIDPDWMPFEKIAEDGTHIGISSDYFNIFEKQLGIPIKLIKTNTWTQTLEFTENRTCDILTLGNATPKREKYLNFTKPYLKIPFILATKQEQYYVDEVRYLRDKTVGVVKNNALVNILKNKYPNLKIKEVKSNDEGLKEVQDNKIYAFAGNMLSVSYILHKKYMNDLKIMNSLGDNTSNLAIGVRNDDLLLLNIFNKLVDDISEELSQNIMNKYLSIKYEKGVSYAYLNEILLFIFFVLVILGSIQYKLKQINKKLEKKIEERTGQLLQQSRLAQMGEMISMIAHQWRQPLTSISATTNNISIKLMLDEKISKEDLQHEMSLISDYSQHLSKTIDDFRNFFKINKDKKDTTLEKIVENSIYISKNSLDAYNIEIDLKFKCNKVINTYATEVNQVVLNLIKNSQDALVERDIISPKIKIKTYTKDANVFLEIVDNAGGISEDIINKVFDPYFSTKNEKDGIGLGLYMSKIIISEHCKGSLLVKNGKRGAIFTIKIPI